MNTTLAGNVAGEVALVLPGIGAWYVKHHQKLRIEKWLMPCLPEGFIPTRLSLMSGARAAYRDPNRRSTVHLLEYEDYWTAHVDHFNPDAGFVEYIGHAVFDAPEVTAAVVAGCLLVASLASR